MSAGFAMLWSKILESSLWVVESKETRLLWIAMLAMKDSEGRILCSLVGLADRAKITLEECRGSLEVLLSPDPNDSSGVEEGRRLRVIPGGWEIVNHEAYRFSTAAKRETWKHYKAQQRARKAMRKRGKPLPGELAATNPNLSQEERDRASDAALPEKAVVASAMKALADEE